MSDLSELFDEDSLWRNEDGEIIGLDDEPFEENDGSDDDESDEPETDNFDFED